MNVRQIFHSNELNVRELELKDAALLAKWLSDPEVLAYYEGRDRPHDLERVIEHFFNDDHDVTRCIVQCRGKDIGYIQFYKIGEDEIAAYGYRDYNGQVYGMDQFIGETSYWNQGIGTQLVKETVKYLIRLRGATKVVMDPQAWNARALRVYEKCGFVKKKYLERHEWHEGEFRDCWLIEYEYLDSE